MMTNPEFDYPFGHDNEMPAVDGESLDDYVETPEVLSECGVELFKVADAGILRALRFDLVEVPKDSVTLALEALTKDIHASTIEEPEARQAFIERQNSRHTSKKEAWPFSQGGLEARLLDRVLAQNPVIQTEELCEVSHITMEMYAPITAPFPLIEAVPESAMIEAIRIQRFTRISDLTIDVRTQGGYEINYVITGETDAPYQALGGMWRAREAGVAPSLYSERTVTVPGSDDSSLAYDKAASGETLRPDELESMLTDLAQSEEDHALGLRTPTSGELTILANVVTDACLKAAFERSLTLTVELDLGSDQHTEVSIDP
jgi:hypothetical protein